jgi:hypothetical protein
VVAAQLPLNIWLLLVVAAGDLIQTVVLEAVALVDCLLT